MHQPSITQQINHLWRNLTDVQFIVSALGLVAVIVPADGKLKVRVNAPSQIEVKQQDLQVLLPDLLISYKLRERGINPINKAVDLRVL